MNTKWIKWEQGECPVCPSTTVEAKIEDTTGYVHQGEVKSKFLNWNVKEQEDISRITAYRVISYNVEHLAKYIHKNDKYGYLNYEYHLHDVYDVCMEMYGLKTAQHVKDLLYLHDTIEDHPECKQFLLDNGVDEWTIYKLEELNVNNYKNRKEYITYIDEQAGWDVRLVKICDTIANLKCSLRNGNMAKNRARIRKYSHQLSQLLGNNYDIIHTREIN